MPNALDAVKSLLDGVKQAFGEHGEFANAAHPLAEPVKNLETALAQIELLQTELPTEEPSQRVVNPRELEVVVESPGIDTKIKVTDCTIKLISGRDGIDVREQTFTWVELFELLGECPARA